MLMKQNPGEQAAAVASTRSEKVLKPKPCRELIGAKVETRFVHKRGGVIPAKRRLVKRMMFDCIVEHIASAFCFRRPSSSAAAQAHSDKSSGQFKMAPPLDSSNAKKSKTVFPHP